MIRLSDRQKMLFRKFGKPVLISLLLLLNGLAAWNFTLLSRDLLLGDLSADELLVRPIYHPFRVPDRSIAASRQAVDRVGSDFAQVYFPAQDVRNMQDAFDVSRTLDPWKRPSRYAPFVELACAATICNLDFGPACLLHIVFQLLLLYAVLYWMFHEFGLREHFLPCLLAVNAFLFVTPVGLSWFERGQFSLYLAASYPLLVIGLVKKQWPLVAAAAALAFVKWTSFPAIFVILVVYLLSSSSRQEFKPNLVLCAVFGGTVIALLVIPAIFTRGTDAFILGLLTQEMEDVPKGATLLRYVPRLVVKLLPLAAILAGWVSARRSRALPDWLVPFATGAVILMLVYPTRAYEYALASLLGFIPVLIWWAHQAEGEARGIRRAMLYLLLLFMASASFSTRLFSSLYAVVEVYVVVAVVFMLVPVLLALAKSARSEPEPAAGQA